MIRDYIDEALRRAHYDMLEDDTFCGEVPELRGVLATGASFEECRTRLGEVIEEWILVRVARELDVPPLGDLQVKVHF